MTQELAKQFNGEVERYRRALLYFAGRSEWAEFKERAARLFEYLENIEASERERRFYKVFYCILAALTLGVMVVLGIDPQISAEWTAYRQSLLLASLAGCSFELFFYLDFRWYVAARMAGFARRKAAFIRGMESDFRSFASRAGEAVRQDPASEPYQTV